MRKFHLIHFIIPVLSAILTSTYIYAGGNEGSPIGAPGEVCAGVNIHFVRGHDKDLDMIATAGFRYVRMDFIWEETEKSKGVYDWSGYDELAVSLSKRGLQAIFILDYSNPLYEDTVAFKDTDSGTEYRGIASPRHPESIAAFARWAAASAIHFKGQNIVWEIWNEPNVSFWRPIPEINNYIALAMATAEAIKEVVPDAVIIGPATSKIPLPFLESFLASGILDYLDGVSVHPYRDYALSPETVADDYRNLLELIHRYAPKEKKDLPIISSEWGYASATNGVSVEIQAEWLVRMQLSNLQNGVPLSIWYDWKNDGTEPGNFEHNCGTVTYDLKPKPAYNAAATMNRQLQGFVLSQRIVLESKDDYILVFRNKNGSEKICAWTTGETHVVIPVLELTDVSGTTGVDGYGRPIKLKTEKGKLAIQLETLPQYLRIPKGDIHK